MGMLPLHQRWFSKYQRKLRLCKGVVNDILSYNKSNTYDTLSGHTSGLYAGTVHDI